MFSRTSFVNLSNVGDVTEINGQRNVYSSSIDCVACAADSHKAAAISEGIASILLQISQQLFRD